MKITAHTNSGIAVAERPPTEMMRSRALPSCMAAYTPPAIASGTTMMKASSASLPEATSGSISTSDTSRFRIDSPRSPVKTPEIQSQYCTTSERSVPSCSFITSTEAWSANGPRTRRPTSPGSTWAARKITMLSTSSVISPRAARFARKRAMVCSSLGRSSLPSGLLARLADVDVAHGRHIDARHRGLRRRQVEVEIGEDDRHLVEQHLLDLLGRRALGLQVDRRDVLGDEFVVVLVLEVGGVPGAVALERRAQEHVRHAAVPVLGDPERGVQPGRLAEHRVAVVAGCVRDVQLDVDARGLEVVLDQLGVLRDLEHLPRAQLEVEVALAGLRQQRLRLLDVLLALCDGLVGRRVDGRERAVVAVVRLLLEQALDDVVSIDQERHRLPHALVGERLL